MEKKNESDSSGLLRAVRRQVQSKPLRQIPCQWSRCSGPARSNTLATTPDLKQERHRLTIWNPPGIEDVMREVYLTRRKVTKHFLWDLDTDLLRQRRRGADLKINHKTLYIQLFLLGYVSVAYYCLVSSGIHLFRDRRQPKQPC